jgi:hypothetical protein
VSLFKLIVGGRKIPLTVVVAPETTLTVKLKVIDFKPLLSSAQMPKVYIPAVRLEISILKSP